MLPFFQTPNLRAKDMTAGAPWDFCPPAEALARVRSLPKESRRAWIAKPSTVWNVYSAVGGVAPNFRVSAENPPACLRGLAADYDMKLTVPEVLGLLNQIKPAHLPNFIEVTHSRNIRLVWVFEREVLTVNSKHCASIIGTFFEELGAATLLPGFDEHSLTPAEVWTNGGEWHTISEDPLPWTFIFGLLCKASQKTQFGGLEIPLEVVEAEVVKQYPHRWKGPFALDQTGVRFWDPAADSPTGCQVKPDGMLCFTGRAPFMSWEALFGAAWAKEKRVLNLGQAAAGIMFDGRYYWAERTHWLRVSREDVLLSLRTNNVSTKIPRGQTASDADRVLAHIQVVNRVNGVGPLVNFPPGLVTIDNRRLLNNCALRALAPSDKQAAGPEDFPWTWKFLNGLFSHPECAPLEHFLAWLQRAYGSMLRHQQHMGQALFICGPKNNGKTLLCYHYLKPLLGGKCSNPYNYFTGVTSFNAELFEAYLLAINDEEAPTRDDVRQKFIARVKAWVVNPEHAYQPKFCDVVNILHTGRIFASLNDDPASIGLIPEVNDNTKDKMMFFGSRPRAEGDPFPDRPTLEALVAAELPLFARWLLDWSPPPEVLSQDRMGVKSFYDPRILTISIQQSPAYGLLELIDLWCKDGPYWSNPGTKTWSGSASALVAQIANVEHHRPVSRDWTASKTGKALTTLTRLPHTGVTTTQNGTSQKIFCITKAEVFQPTLT